MAQPPFEPRVLEDIREHTVFIYPGGGSLPAGTGLILDEQGRVLTCLHTIASMNGRFLLGRAGERSRAILLHEDPKRDLVLLRTGFRTRGGLAWARRDGFGPGDIVLAMGAPYGLDESLLMGYIVHLDRTGTDEGFPHIPFVQTMGISFPGVSGAGVFLGDGRIIGVNRAQFGRAPGTGIGLTVPYETIAEFLEESGGGVQARSSAR